MKQQNLSLTTVSIIGIAALVAGVSARAEHTVEAIPLAPHGDIISYSGGTLALAPTSLVATARGDDNAQGTADDKLLIMTGIDGTPVVSASVIGGFPKSGARWTRLSATRALYQTSGADLAWKTGDEELLIVDGIGSTNTTTRVMIGSLEDNQGGMHVPVRLTTDMAVIPVLGADNVATTADDAVALVTDMGGTPTVTSLPAPFLQVGGRTEPTALSPTSFLLASDGPDGATSTADDVLYLFTDVGGANTRSDIALPSLHEYRPGRPVRLSATMAAVVSVGPDQTYETGDDRVYVISGLGSTNTVTSIEVPYLACCGAARPRVLGPDLLVVPTSGADGVQRSADDSLAFVSGLGGTLVVAHVVVGGMDEDREARPVRLSANRVAVVTNGPDATDNTADDRLAIVSDVGGANTVAHVDIPGLGNGGANEPLPISMTAVLLISGGADGRSRSGNDDVFTLVTGLATASPSAESQPFGVAAGQAADRYGLSTRPAFAGGGRAIALGTGPDGASGQGDDDVIHVIDNLPRERDLSVKKLRIKFKAAKPQKGAAFKVTVDLTLDDQALFAAGDVTISIGNAAETIPADAFVIKRKKPTYKRPKGGSGFIKKVVYNPKNGKLTVSGKGVGTGGEATDPDFVPFTIDITDGLFLGETLTANAIKSGLKYKRPK